MSAPNLITLQQAINDAVLGGRINAALLLVASQNTLTGDTTAHHLADEIFTDPGAGQKYRLAAIAHPKIIASLPEIDDTTIIEVVQELWEKGTFRS